MPHRRPTKSFQQIKALFGKTFHRGDRVVCAGQLGTIVGATCPHVRVRFDGSQIAVPCDPRELHLDESNPPKLGRPSSLS